jgi:hypothetical protein
MANRAFPGTDRHSAASPTLAPALRARRSAGERSGEGGRCGGGYTLRSMGIHEYQAGSVKATLFRPTPPD